MRIEMHSAHFVSDLLAANFTQVMRIFSGKKLAECTKDLGFGRRIFHVSACLLRDEAVTVLDENTTELEFEAGAISCLRLQLS